MFRYNVHCVILLGGIVDTRTISIFQIFSRIRALYRELNFSRILSEFDGLGTNRYQISNYTFTAISGMRGDGDYELY